MNTGTAKAKNAPSTAQLKVLIELHRHIQAHRIAPSYEELGAALGVNKSNVAQTVSRLRRDGFLAADVAGTARYRNLALSDAGLKAVRSALRENRSHAA